MLVEFILKLTLYGVKGWWLELPLFSQWCQPSVVPPCLSYVKRSCSECKEWIITRNIQLLGPFVHVEKDGRKEAQHMF